MIKVVLNAEIEKHSILSDVESHLGRVLVEVNFVAALDWMNTNLYLFFHRTPSPVKFNSLIYKVCIQKICLLEY